MSFQRIEKPIFENNIKDNARFSIYIERGDQSYLVTHLNTNDKLVAVAEFMALCEEWLNAQEQSADKACKLKELYVLGRVYNRFHFQDLSLFLFDQTEAPADFVSTSTSYEFMFKDVKHGICFFAFIHQSLAYYKELKQGIRAHELEIVCVPKHINTDLFICCCSECLGKIHNSAMYSQHISRQKGSDLVGFETRHLHRGDE